MELKEQSGWGASLGSRVDLERLGLDCGTDAWSTDGGLHHHEATSPGGAGDAGTEAAWGDSYTLHLCGRTGTGWVTLAA